MTIVSRDDLLAMKRATGRDKDRQTVAELEALARAEPRQEEAPYRGPGSESPSDDE